MVKLNFDLERFAGQTVLEEAIAESLAARTSKELAADSRMAELVAELVSCVMRKEREIKRELQAEGIVAAKERGVRFGRTPKERPKGYEAMRTQWANGHISARGAAKALGVAHATFLKWARKDLRAL